MGTYLLRRLLLMIPTLIGITFMVFMLIALSPGGIGAGLRMQGGQMEATSRAIREAYLEDRYGLDDPAIVQYVRWLGRISPVKFGERDQVSPAGERVRPPKAPKPPPLWQWFDDALPTQPPAEPLVWPEGATPDERAEVYSRASNAYAQARAGYITARTFFEQELGRYAAAAEVAGGITPSGTVRERVFLRAGPSEDSSAWPALEREAARTLEAYETALNRRARLLAVLAAKPFPEAGVAIIPGYISLASPDFGVSFSRSRPVVQLVADALPVTLLINLIAFPIIYMVAVPMGLLAAVRRGTWFDTLSGGLFIALWSFPTVLAGVLAIGFLANNDYLGLFPVSGLHDIGAEDWTFLPREAADGTMQPGLLLDTLWHVCLPVLCLVYTGFAVLSKQTRAAMLDNFNADYVRTAKAKGVPEKDVVLRHVFRNSLLPLITMFVAIFPAMLSGSVIIERIFTVPGMGSLVFDAINQRDRELVLATTLMIGIVNLVALLVADVLYALADPRITYR